MPAFGIDRGLNLTIAANVTGFINSMNSAEKKLANITNVAKLAGAAFAALGAAGISTAISQAAKFEEQMTELAKVTDPAIAKRMSDSILKLSQDIPIATQALSDIAIQFGRAGVTGRKELTKLTKTASKMAVATDLSASEASQALVKMQSIFELTSKKADNLGSTINELANTSVASSSQIQTAAIRSSAALSNLGLAADQVLALNAAFIKVSPSARRAGTRLRRLGEEVNTLAGDDLKVVSEVLGESTEKINKMTETGEGATQLFLRLADATNTASTQLKDAFGTRVLTALQNLSKITDDVRFKMLIANEEFKEANSLQEEFQRQLNTTGGRFQLMNNQINKTFIQLGNKLLPAVKSAADLMTALSESVGTAGTQFLTLSTAIGGLGAFIGSFVAGPLGALAGALSGVFASAVITAKTQIESFNEAFLSSKEVLADAKEQMIELRKEQERLRKSGKKMTEIVFSQLKQKVDKVNLSMDTFNRVINELQTNIQGGNDALDNQKVQIEGLGKAAENAKKKLEDMSSANKNIDSISVAKDIKTTAKSMDNLGRKAKTTVKQLKFLTDQGLISNNVFNKFAGNIRDLSTTYKTLSKQVVKLSKRLGETTQDEKAKEQLKAIRKELEKFKGAVKTGSDVIDKTINQSLNKFQNKLKEAQNIANQPLRFLSALEEDSKFIDKLSKKLTNFQTKIGKLAAQGIISPKEIKKATRMQVELSKVINKLRQAKKEGSKIIGQQVIKNIEQTQQRVRDLVNQEKRSTSDLIIARRALKNEIKETEKNIKRVIDQINKGVIKRSEGIDKLKKIRQLLAGMEQQQKKTKKILDRRQDTFTVEEATKFQQKLAEIEDKSTGVDAQLRKVVDVANELGSRGQISKLKSLKKGVSEALEEFKKTGDIVQLSKTINKELGKVENELTEFEKIARDSFNAASEAFEEQMAEIIETGEAGMSDLKEFAREVLKEIIRIIAIKNALRPALNAIGGQIGLSGTNTRRRQQQARGPSTEQLAIRAGTQIATAAATSALQHGGRLKKGETAIVGESGPELFTANQAGRVLSNQETKQKMKEAKSKERPIVVKQNIEFNPRVQQEARRQVNQAAPQIKKAAEEGVKQKAKRGGSDQDIIRGKE